MKLLLTIVACLFLTSCKSMMMSDAKKECVGFGIPTNTTSYSECVQAQYNMQANMFSSSIINYQKHKEDTQQCWKTSQPTIDSHGAQSK